MEAWHANPTCSFPAPQGMQELYLVLVDVNDRWQMVGKVEVRDSHRDTNANQDELADELATRPIALHPV